ncbi:bifunctional 4-hydroxy-2-oxoglutarate aldolase/2-dehydro-3-deoxy-phosphogluconate aldolase [Azospirillum agricola]|uniref:bifunctional 4-hydroxy-2-oxoglutarate aldolase/2-dehydro-3-deoxy-phosphogluconate aldolase n=1 Tax=Azospirillum agricola TaxID=1720247 RepID=UPI000A0F3A1D|nr:bifunctional 4-hydroxy-2-oxoglutarate aldolase/2-dehydro-3-deoxy-phosphogluconate aldolase [Azospirillum agricola]SMH36213.1 2-dehydro-3-deoxyphosphogluconate aldolase / (4S)-4-hydroxy-2-oxoglutarate aldolase [Azospirillum lipoferum]
MTATTDILDQLVAYGVVPVIRNSSADLARTAVGWLREAGYGTFEITMTTPGAVGLIEELTAEGGALIGAGTVLTAAGVADVVKAGARYVVSPCVLPEVAAACRDHGVACLMGALTPSEVHAASVAGADAVKIFPASTVGPAHIKALKSVFPGIRFVPTGGIDAGNVASYVAAGVACVGAGGKLVDESLVKKGDRDGILAAGRQLLDAYRAAKGV